MATKKEPALAFLNFSNVSYSVAGRLILDRVSFGVEQGETLVLLGRSGSGKTTVLRLTNGMLRAAAGSICIGGQDVASSDPVRLRRRIGYVIQEFGLLPHWTVAENIGLVPRLEKWPAERRRIRAQELMGQLGLAGLDNRLPHELSGGQRQRVGVARALAADPPVLLFDEPFGALDPVTRHEMQQLFLNVRERYQGASLFVTHDVLEALSIGTRIAVLDQGRMEGLFTPAEFMQAETPVARSFLNTLPRELMARSN